MNLEQTVEKIPANMLELKLIEWQTQGWAVVALAPASSLHKKFPEGLGEEVREYQVILKRQTT